MFFFIPFPWLYNMNDLWRFNKHPIYMITLLHSSSENVVGLVADDMVVNNSWIYFNGYMGRKKSKVAQCFKLQCNRNDAV